MKRWLKGLQKTHFFKSLVYFIIGVFSYPGIAIFNKLKITGTENIEKLPKRNVLFVSNHQTYFADVITMLHIFSAVKWRRKNKLGFPVYLFNPCTRVNFVAATETMRKTILSRFFTWGGAITVKRTWNKGGTEVRRGLDPGDTRKISQALDKNWVITFPQGTTKAFAPGRKGTAFIIKHRNPVVVPVVINGFRLAFDKKGLKLRKRGTLLSVHFKQPMKFSEDDSIDQILQKVMDAIEQSKKFMEPQKPQ